MLPCLLIGTKRSLCRTRTARESARPFVRRNSIRTGDSDRVGRQPDTDAIRGRIAASSASIARHRGDGRAAKPPTAMQIFSLRECPIPAGISPSPGLLVSVASSHNPGGAGTQCRCGDARSYSAGDVERCPLLEIMCSRVSIYEASRRSIVVARSHARMLVEAGVVPVAAAAAQMPQRR